MFVLVSRDQLPNEQRKDGHGDVTGNRSGMEPLQRGYSMKLHRFKRTIFTAIFVLLLGVIHGCSIKQTVKPVELTGQPMEICIVKNEKVRPSFLEAYSDALKAKSVQVRTLDETTSLNECTFTSTYAAHWAWDLAMYMRYAEIKVYRGVALVGLAVYDATWGGGRPDKFINAENKIHELVDQLFSTGKSRVLTPTPSVSAAPIE